MSENGIGRPLGVKLTLIGLFAIVVGSLVYTALNVNYLYTAVNLLGLILALVAFAGLFLMKKWGAVLTAVAAAFNMSAQMFNFQSAYLYYPNFALVDYVTGVFIPIVAFIIGSAVLVYIFKQIFANKFSAKAAENETVEIQRTTATYLAVLINVFFIAYQLAWAYTDQTINAFNATSIVLAAISIVGVLSLSKWGEVATEFTAVLFLFRIVEDLQWTANYGLTNYSNGVFAILLAMEGVGIALAPLQAGYVFKRISKNYVVKPAAPPHPPKTV